MISTIPFRRGDFNALPQKPNVPHRFFDTIAMDIQVNSKAFGDMKVHVRRFGEGPPLLLLHGLMTSSYSWRYTFEELGKHFTCYAPDLPGAGHSEHKLETPYTPAHLGQWLGEVMHTLHIYGCPVIGNSMGGYIAMHLAIQEPDAISRLLNLHSPGIPEFRLQALDAVFRIPKAKRLLRWFVQRDAYRFAHKNVHYYDERLKSLEEAREYGTPLNHPEGVQAFIKYLDETMNIQYTRRFKKILNRKGFVFPIPLQLQYAKQDPMVPPRIGKQWKKQIPQAELIYLNQASHFAHVDSPDQFLMHALPFLQQK